MFFRIKEAADNIGWVCCLFSNCSVRRKVLDKAGVFDVIFKGWGLEDIELGYRFFKEKFSFSYEEDIANYHVDHATNSQQMLVEMGRNLKRLSKNASRRGHQKLYELCGWIQGSSGTALRCGKEGDCI